MRRHANFIMKYWTEEKIPVTFDKCTKQNGLVFLIILFSKSKSKWTVYPVFVLHFIDIGM